VKRIGRFNDKNLICEVGLYDERCSESFLLDLFDATKQLGQDEVICCRMRNKLLIKLLNPYCIMYFCGLR
jgi:hypothetical protein